MVMPCSRSARRPSVSRARLVYSWPRCTLARSTEASWSSKMALESNSSRPIRVLLPSSTEPAVASRNSSISEIPFLLAVLHGRLGEPVVGPGGTSLGDAGGRHLLDDLVDGGRHRLHRAGAVHVAHGPVADGGLVGPLFWPGPDPLADGQQHAVPFDDLPAVGEVHLGDLQALALDVLPHVELGPVGNGEGPDVLALADAPVVERPQLGPLRLGIPLPEVVPERKHPLLGPGLLLVPPAATEAGVEAVLGDGVEQGDGLQPVAARPHARLLHRPPPVDRLL